MSREDRALTSAGRALAAVVVFVAGAGCSDGQRDAPRPVPSVAPAPTPEPTPEVPGPAPLPALRSSRVLRDPNAAASGHFGTALAIDGTTLAVSAMSNAGPEGCARPRCLPGRVYVYELDGDDAPIELSLPERPDGYFGASLSLEGERLVVGAPRPSVESDTGGEVYVFRRAGDGWEREAVLEGAPPGARLGVAVALRGDWIAASAPYAPGGGVVHVFRRGPEGWRRAARLANPGGGNFGDRVVLTDASLLLSAARHRSVGGVWVLPRRADGFGEPVEVGPPEPASARSFGYALAAGEDWMLIGHPGERARAHLAGAVHRYRLGDGAPERTSLLTPPEASPCETFGSGLAIVGGTILVAAPRRVFGGECERHRVQPVVHRFDRSPDGTWEPVAPLGAPEPAADFGWKIAASGARVVVSAIDAAAPAEGDAAPLPAAGAVYLFEPP